jgi:hypothetical protein
MTNWDDLPDARFSDEMPELFTDSDSDDDDFDRACFNECSDDDYTVSEPKPAPRGRKRARVEECASLPKNTHGRHLRKNVDYEKKAFTIAFYDSLPKKVPSPWASGGSC